MPNSTGIPDLGVYETAGLFKEAIALRMVPCDFRVWRDYLSFRLKDADNALTLVNLYWELLHTHKIDARTIAEWCKNDETFCPNVYNTLCLNPSEKVKSENDNFFFDPRYHRTPGPFRQREDLEDLPLVRVQGCHRDKFREQTGYCFTFNEARPKMDSAPLPRRYDYLVYSLLAWKCRPGPAGAFSRADENVWYYLGYLTSTDNEEFHKTLTAAYDKSFSTRMGISEMAFHQFKAGETARYYASRYVRQNFRDTQYLDKLEDFFKETKGVWELEQLLQSGVEYESIPHTGSRFSEAASDYGFSHLRIHTQDVAQLKQSALHLSEIYREVLKKDPMELRIAYMDCKVLKHAQEVCRAKNPALLPFPQLVVAALEEAHWINEETKNELQRSGRENSPLTFYVPI